MPTTLLIPYADMSMLPRSTDVSDNTSYYRFYQSKLRQLLTQTRYRKEQETRIARQKLSADMERFAQQQRFHRECMNHIRQHAKQLCSEQPIEKNLVREPTPEQIVSRTPKLSVQFESRPRTTTRIPSISM
jgi:hypothetical protein